VEVEKLIREALAEDIGAGDITSAACVPADRTASGRFVAKQECVVAGLDLLPAIYELQPEICFPNGSRVAAGSVIARIWGPARRLLERERVALNFIQRLSGIATLTRRFVDAVEGTGVTILDTRKTTPGLRKLEKQAVAAGGGRNHRLGLYDAILIKENHVAAAGGIRAAVAAANRGPYPVEVEVRNLEELDEALEAGAARLLLDNMTPEQVRACVQRVRERGGTRPEVEVSGGITLANVRQYALAGPDFISVGALTHSAPAADISFLLQAGPGA
jgi:nicotinate-nucleotide pyrophosphorylase (carboxylating)